MLRSELGNRRCLSTKKEAGARGRVKANNELVGEKKILLLDYHIDICIPIDK